MPFKVRFKGFTLVELLVVLVIFLIVGTLLFYILTKALRWVSSSGGEVKQELSVDVNTDLLVFDLKHAGYGISRDENKPVIEYNSKSLYVRSTLNPFKPSQPVGFQICNGTQLIEAYKFDSSWPSCVWFDLDRFPLNTGNPLGCTCSNNPSKSYSIAYAVDDTTSCKGNDSWCCEKSYCTTIKWVLNTPTNAPKTCLSETKVFSAQLKSYTRPVINCVADWDVWFGMDMDNDGLIDTWINSMTGKSNEELKKQLKVIKIYMLVQASPTSDPKYDYCTMSNANCDADCGSGTITVDHLGDKKVCLKHPNDPSWKHYRWKIVEITVSGFPNIP